MSSELELEMLQQFSASLYPNMPEAEYKFGEHRGPKGRRAWYRFDFAWPDLHIALEVEGATWQQGRHTRGSGFEKDCHKYNEAACLGWTVLRVTANMVADGTALEFVRRALASH